MNANIEQKLETIPASPGVYLMKNAAGEVVYVGKAVSLRSRVRSYFGPQRGDFRPAARHLASKAADIEFIVTSNEHEAFILENNLIKKFKPRYNIRLRDDKTFLSLKVDTTHPFPSIVPVRRRKRDGALYFGPYTSARAVRSTLRFLRTITPFRICSDTEFRNRTRPCIQYQIERCSGPCCGLISRDAYRADLDGAIKVLRGEVDELRRGLQARMEEASSRMEYESAARLRDQLQNLEKMEATQKVELPGFADADVLGFFQEDGLSEVAVLFFRDGKLLASSPFSFDADLEPDELLAQFVLRFYGELRHIPREILLPLTIPDQGAVEKYLRARRGSALALRAPQRGDARKLVALAVDNARQTLRASRGIKQVAAGIAEELRSVLDLPAAPVRIEGVDVSNTQGGEAVGAVVHFKDGEPLKSRYRRYRVKTVAGADDYAMIREVVLRRVRRGGAEEALPDLLLIDGGKGHVAAAHEAAAAAGAAGLAIAGMAKGETRARAIADQPEAAGAQDRVFTPGRPDPIELVPGSGAMHLLQRIRDEAHRFAISYHRKVRSKRSRGSLLDDVRGLGPGLRRRLLTRFGGLQGLKAASLDDLKGVEGVGPVLAQRIRDALRGGPV